MVVELPKKIAAPIEFYQCEDCEDFPEDRYELEKEEKAEKERVANVARARVIFFLSSSEQTVILFICIFNRLQNVLKEVLVVYQV